MKRRKVSFKLYPTDAQREMLDRWVRLHCELYNAALEERIDCYRKTGKGVSYQTQQNVLPALKKDRPELIALGSHALQETLRRVDRAYKAFFRRVRAGQAPGFPRFKSAKRFRGFTYPDPAGWSLKQHGPRGAHIRVGEMTLKARGRHRFKSDEEGAIVPNDLTLTHRHGQWFASVTLRVSDAACARERKDDQLRGFDLGTETLATFDNGERVENPRWLKEALPELRRLQRARACKRKRSLRYRRLSCAIGRLHDRIKNVRGDAWHKATARWVSEGIVLATEELSPSNLSRSAKGTTEKPGKNVKQKAGLNREILSAGWGMARQMLEYKAAEAGTRLHLSNTRRLKPTQRCHECWRVKAKTLSQRQHRCECGADLPRDQNSALVCLKDAFSAGTVEAASADNAFGGSDLGVLSALTRETPTTTDQV